MVILLSGSAASITTGILVAACGILHFADTAITGCCYGSVSRAVILLQCTIARQLRVAALVPTHLLMEGMGTSLQHSLETLATQESNDNTNNQQNRSISEYTRMLWRTLLR